MLTWWLYSIVVAGLVGAAALAAERALRIAGMAMRWVWAAAMVASVAIPMVVALLPDRGAPLAVSDVPSPSTLVILPAIAIGEAGIAWERWAVAGWAVVSLALGFGVLACALLLARRRRGWSAGELDGAPVLWSADTGPAVVGLRRPQIVVPRWAADLPAPMRRLLVAHEREHIAARDPVLFHALLALVIALPWNAVLWWQLRRFRAAMELDCDARVLRAGADRRGYAELLLHAAERFAAAPLPVLAFAWPGSLLKRRMRLLAPRRARYARVQIAVAGAVAVVLVVQACDVRPEADSGNSGSILQSELPTEPAALPDTANQLPPLNVEEAPHFTPYTVKPELINRSEVANAMSRMYPALLREAGIGGKALVWLFIDEGGNVLQTKIQRSSGREELDAAALRVANEMQFKPAINGDRIVKAWIAVPLVFGRGGEPSGPPPTEEQERAVENADMTTGPVFTPMTVFPGLINPEHVRARLTEFYPALLRGAGIGGEVKVWMLIDESGKVIRSQIQKSSGRPELDAAALRLTEEMQFTPAQNKGSVVKVWVALPVIFTPDTE